MEHVTSPNVGAAATIDEAASARATSGDTTHALAFLKQWAPNGPWVLTSINPDTEKIETQTFRPEREVNASAWVQHRQGKANIYFSVNRPKRDLTSKAKKEDIGWAVALHVDADPRKDCDLGEERTRILATLRAYEPPATVIIDTGGGYSAFWVLREPVVVDNPADIEELNSRLAVELGGDRCHNVDRIMRLPGTVNLPNKTKRLRGRVPAPTRVIEEHWHRRYDLDTFSAILTRDTNKETDCATGRVAAPKAAPVGSGRDRGDLGALPGPLRELITSGDATRWAGDRSRAVWYACCALVRAGWNDGQITAIQLDATLGISVHVLAQGNPQLYAGRQAERARTKVESEPPVLNPDEPRASARAFVTSRSRPLVCHAGDLYEWRDSHYRKLDESDVRSDLYAFLEKAMRRGRKGLEPFAPNRAKVDNVLDALTALVHLPSELTPPCWIEGEGEDGPIMACRNGLLSLSDGKLLPHTPTYFNTAAADFDYDPLAEPPREWLKFLDSIWPQDQQAVDTLQEIFGYVLSGDNRHQKMFLLVGPPRCGKGTISNILIKLLGGRGHAGLPLGSLNGDFGLQPLLGKMLVIVPDARLQGRSHTIVERLLAISGGDDLTVARKNTTSVTVRLPARFSFLTNVLPAMADPSGTIASRFIVQVMAVSHLGREDLDLERRLTEELPGVLNWATTGWQRLEERGRFIQPASGRETATNLSFLASPMKQFIAETYELSEGDVERTDDVYNEWCSWWVNSGQSGEPGNKTAFGIRLTEAFPHIRREERRKMTRGESIKHYVYVGLHPAGRDRQAALLHAEEYEADAVPF